MRFDVLVIAALASAAGAITSKEFAKAINKDTAIAQKTVPLDHFVGVATMAINKANRELNTAVFAQSLSKSFTVSGPNAKQLSRSSYTYQGQKFVVVAFPEYGIKISVDKEATPKTFSAWAYAHCKRFSNAVDCTD